jgi:RimJ/RimL family protein N-acetyltransferase
MTPAAASSLLSPAAVDVRAIAPHDAAALRDAFLRLSPAARYARFLTPKRDLPADELRTLTDLDHRTHEALVALAPDDGRIVGVARYAAAGAGVADFAVAVEEAQHGRGIATLLGWRLLAAAAGNGVELLTATTLTRNLAARALLGKLGFREQGLDHGVVDLALRLAW